MSTQQIISLVDGKTRSKVSSVLNKNSKQFGKQHIFDGSDETCWNSHQGTPQFLIFEFNEKVVPQKAKIMFQGGFVGKDCEFLGSTNDSDWSKICDFYPEDNNNYQEFDIACTQPIDKLKILFNASTDFYGRVTIYKLEILGMET